ncbi:MULTISPECIES: DUF5985 family protein [Legionella]|uniref:Uncharacterized protein n=1 Tax=Legionella steelei TaxID=947033 RepID=A0A0W0ZCU0_9GAMM|nr:MULTISPECIES: DUF5985 family protein [Legionella]KTD66887.1 hypothetical protein Lste_3093 [Legionella steelei]MBN9227378.1 hypothetical protein [Legionella steelei]
MMINAMLVGAFVMASIIVSLFFLRFWKSTHDRFFLYFAMSFLLEALSRVIIGTTNIQNENPLIYLIRLVAYFLIIIAIYEKNKKRR